MFTNVAELTNQVKEMELLLRCLFSQIFATCREYFSKRAVCGRVDTYTYVLV